MTTMNDRRINVFFFLSSVVGCAAGGSGLFLQTTNGGLSWSTSTISPGSELTGLWFTSPNTGYLNIAGGISKTINSTVSWSQQNVSPPTPMTQIVFANDSVGFAVGDAGIYKTKQALLTSLSNNKKDEDYSLFPNPANELFHLNNGIEGTRKITIYDQIGRPVKVYENDNQSNVDISSLEEGVYSIVIESQSQTLRKKLVISR